MPSRFLTTPLFLSLLVLPCRGQNQNPAPAPQASPAGAPATPKKVWTNDDLARTKGAVSVIGTKLAADGPSAAPTPVASAEVLRIKSDLGKLEAQLDLVNKRLATYEEFEQGKAVSEGGRDLSKGYSRTPVDQQVAQLQEKRKQLSSQISDLYDEARKKGIDPGQLR